MSMAIKIFILFLFVESSRAKYVVNMVIAYKNENNLDQSDIDYFSYFRETIGRWQHEADEKHPLWTSTNYTDRALFLQDRAQAYVKLWGRYKNYPGYPYHDLRNKLEGDLWLMQYTNYCRQDDGKNLEECNLLTYLTSGLSA